MSWFRGIIAHAVLMVLGWKSFGFDQPFAKKTEKKTRTLLSPILLTTSFFCYLIWYRFYCLLVNVLWHRFKYYYFKSPQFCIGAAASINLGYTASSVICLAIYYSSHENIAKGANSIIWLLRYLCFFIEGGDHRAVLFEVHVLSKRKWALESGGLYSHGYFSIQISNTH